MNGIELLNNLVDELNKARDLLLMHLNGEEIPKESAQELFFWKWKK